MRRCIQLAKNGIGSTYPNPLVGSVLVYQDRIIGEGWHYQAGLAHAEVNAIASVTNKTLLSDATIYVSLEPCSHFGKTPPCADHIISTGIKKVVIGTTDPNPKVAGRGIKKLQDAGCEVIVGILQAECAVLNKRFFTFQQKKRPYIFLKWAETADGFIAPATRENQQPVWITNGYSQQLSHKMRAQEQAILVGTQTVLDDNPSLTTRKWYGKSPTRFVLDKKLRTSPKSAIYTNDSETIILSEQLSKFYGNATFEYIDYSKNIAEQICTIAYKKNLQSLIIEGGAQTLQTFIDANIWDEAFLFKGIANFGEGSKAPTLSGVLLTKRSISNDLLFHYQNKTN